jgi:hypothetical protein
MRSLLFLRDGVLRSEGALAQSSSRVPALPPCAGWC